MLNVQIKRLRPSAVIPEYKTPLAAAVDVAADISEPLTISPGQRAVLIPTGIAAYIGDSNYAYFIYPRSGTGHKQGLVLGNGTGVIDADYQGEVMISAWVRPGHDAVTINPGDRIAQLVFAPIARVNWELVEEFTENTVRGAGGFSSTGI